MTQLLTDYCDGQAIIIGEPDWPDQWTEVDPDGGEDPAQKTPNDPIGIIGVDPRRTDWRLLNDWHWTVIVGCDDYCCWLTDS